jgi:hypothetical protein
VWHAWVTWEIHTDFWYANLKGRDHSEDVDLEGRIILEWILGKSDEKVWAGFVWLRIGASGGLL